MQFYMKSDCANRQIFAIVIKRVIGNYRVRVFRAVWFGLHSSIR